MEQKAIFGPLLAMIFLTLLVWLYMYSRRIPFILAQKLDLDTLTRAEFTDMLPPAVSNPSDNLKNLFEMPVLFYALTVYLYVTGQVDGGYVNAAWVFVAFRVLHSLVHCTVNIVRLRFFLHLVATLAIWFIAIRAAAGFFAR
jgi:hypothetical protein